ncbi:fatty acyl-AMP ligase [Streptomyces bambusae]|uniref:fatty acyl-AMP ligase n=1 Tax=Streptomyces bambusae TaxID=1550616 RepID=UPI0021556B01|nr:fatty acyl-AMP ligase [Streptomyces bambusae]
MTGSATFTDVLRERAAHLSGRDALVFLHERPGGGTEAEHLTYGELDRAARSLAVRLREHGAQGQPVPLLYPPGPGFLKAFAGCLYAGAIAVPAPLPGDRGERLQRVSGILRDTGAQLVLTDSAHAPDVSLWLAMAGRGETVCLATDVDEAAAADPWQPPATGPDDLAFLQYTSGSTSQPRGVMVSHRNLIANMEAMRRVLGSTADDVFGSWLPHYHDMGLICHLLHPLWLGTRAVQMAPHSFIKRPVRWLRSIGEYGVTIGGGPNFSYDLCVRRTTDEQLAGLDLSSWRLAINGAEPVRPTTLEAFADRFAPAGLRREALYPAYGLAEATLVVSGGRPGEPFRTRTVDAAGLEYDELRPPRPGQPVRTLVGSGAVRDFAVRIVDPVTGGEVPDGRVGEIWVRGDSVAQGYWRRPAETARTFHAVVDDGESDFLRTGDLGVLDGDELYVTGRLKELIILGGRNIYPQDVEWAVREREPALAGAHGAVFTVEAGNREQLVVVHEVRTETADWDRLRELARRVQILVGQDFDVPAGNVVLVRPGTLRRTTSGKIQRTLIRRLFLEGGVVGSYEVLDPAVRALVRPRHELLGEDLLRPSVHLPPAGADLGTAW